MPIFDLIAWFLAGFYTFVAIFYGILIPARKHHYKQDEVVAVGRRYSLHWWNHLVFRGFRLLIWAVCVSRLIWPSIDNYLGVFVTFAAGWFNFIGVFLLLLGFALAIASNINLRHAWRSGIDLNSSASLIDNGLYRFSRNPSYLGVGCAQFGFFIALPSVFTLICLVVGMVSLYLQVLLEEKHLKTHLGDRYTQYQRKTPRWI